MSVSRKVLLEESIGGESPVFPEQIGLTVKGYGSMQDIMNLDACTIDLTKPIYEQVFDGHGQLKTLPA